MLRFWSIIICSLALLAGCDGRPQFKSTDITGADYGRDFTLADHTGKKRTLADFRGKVVVMFFGYTRCPDVCPTTLAELKAVKEQLGEDGKKLQRRRESGGRPFGRSCCSRTPPRVHFLRRPQKRIQK